MENQPSPMNQKLYQFQALKEQRDFLQEQLEYLSVALKNYYTTKTTIEKLKEVDETDELLLPMGGLINLKANLKEPDKVILYITDDVAIEKNLDDAIEYIDNLITQTNEQIKGLNSQLQKLEYALRGMSQELTQNYQGMQRQP